MVIRKDVYLRDFMKAAIAFQNIFVSQGLPESKGLVLHLM